jgi:hypothetical protein
MSINKRIGAIVLAGAALTWQAQAQSTSIIQPGVQAATNNSLSLPPLTTRANLGSDTILSGGLENSRELGVIVRGGIATRIGSDGAVYVEIAVWPKNKELFIQAWLNVSSNTMVTVSFQNLSQFQNFIFASGTTNEQVAHQAIGINTRFRVDSGLVKYVEARGYYISAPSQDLSDKEYTIDTASLFQIYNDPRRIAGSNIAGVGWVLRLGSDDNRYTLDIEGGYEQTKDATILTTPTTKRGTGGLKLGYHPSRDTELYGRVGTSVGGTTTHGEIGVKSGYMNLSYSTANGWTTQFWVRIPLNWDFSLASKQDYTPSSAKSPSDTYNPRSSVSYAAFMAANPNWTAKSQRIRDGESIKEQTGNRSNTILAYVQEKNSAVPKTVHATVDRTAIPKLIISVDPSTLPTNATLDKKNGDITLSEALGFGSLISATNTTNWQSLPSDSFTLGTNTLTIHPRVLESILSTGNNTLIIDTTLAITKLVVEKWSVKILSVSVTRKILNTKLVPGNIACTSTTITTANGTTCSITPMDPDGISIVTATFRGVDTVVTKTGNTYSTGLLTSTTVGVFPVIWSLTGKNPDGTNETIQSTQQSITVTMPTNVPGTIATPSLTSKTSTSINTAPGAVTGMTNVRVVLYSDAGLTVLVGTDANGDFTGLSHSTTYYAATMGDDVNESTGATETKRSTGLAIATDAPANVPGTIATPSLTSKTSTSINTAPGAVTGMTNVRVVLYSDAGLTVLVGTDANGDFTGLSHSTTYYAATMGDDVNESTGATETKRSTGLAIATDAPANTAPTALTLTPGAGLTQGSLMNGQSVGTMTCTDLESTTCTYTISGQSTAGAFAVSSGGVLTLVNTGLTQGTYTVTLVGTDAGGLTRSEVKSITVNAPALTTISGGSVSINSCSQLNTCYGWTVDSVVVTLASGVTVATWQLYSEITGLLLTSGSWTPPSSISFLEITIGQNFGTKMRTKLIITDSLNRTVERLDESSGTWFGVFF